MAYQVLARKWRPKNFADLVGQEHVVKALKHALAKGFVHHAYLLTGTRGVGKTTIARILAKSLNCEAVQDGEPCGCCAVCCQIDDGRFVDLLEIDAASNTGIDNIREVLENAQYAPTVGRYKVYIIDEVHMLSKPAFNAMLKTLEEPPAHVKFILATTDPHKVPVTVLSRCLQFVLRHMTARQVAGHLAYVLQQEEVPFEAGALQLLGSAAAGSMRDALSLLDQVIAIGAGRVAEQDVRQMIGAVDSTYIYALLQGLICQDGAALMETVREIAARAVGFDQALAELAALLQRLALFKLVPQAVAADDPEYSLLQQFADCLGDEQIQLYYQCAVHGRQDLGLAPDEYAGFVMSLLRMLAFAPMAAQAVPLDGMIEGTRLGGGHADGGGDKLPVASLPAVENIVGKRLSQPLSAAVAPSVSAEKVLCKPSVGNGGGHDVRVDGQTAVSEADGPPWEDSATLSDDAVVQEAVDRSDDDLTVPAVQDVLSECVLADGGLRQTADAVLEVKAVSELPSADGALSDSLPDFAATNWPTTVKRLSSEMGAAQMLAQHIAWVDYDASRQVLRLALSAGATKMARKDYFEKIRMVLSAAYELPDLQLETCDWRDDADWETPQMYRMRLEREGLDRAQTALENEPFCQQLMRDFDCQGWKPDSLQCLQH